MLKFPSSLILITLKETNIFLMPISFQSNERETAGFAWDEYLHSRLVFRLCAMQVDADVLYVYFHVNCAMFVRF